MNEIDDFKLQCEKEKKKDDELMEIWKILYIKQKDYGNKYKPLYKGSFFATKKEICPNCKSELMHKRLYKTEHSDIPSVVLLLCNNCGYKYAL